MCAALPDIQRPAHESTCLGDALFGEPKPCSPPHDAGGSGCCWKHGPWQTRARERRSRQGPRATARAGQRRACRLAAAPPGPPRGGERRKARSALRRRSRMAARRAAHACRACAGGPCRPGAPGMGASRGVGAPGCRRKRQAAPHGVGSGAAALGVACQRAACPPARPRLRRRRSRRPSAPRLGPRGVARLGSVRRGRLGAPCSAA